jgi:hypothetical protein
MSKVLKAVGIASLLMFGTTTLMAQTQTDTPKAPSSSGAVKDEKPTDPNQARLPEVKKLEKDEKAGNKSTGN